MNKAILYIILIFSLSCHLQSSNGDTLSSIKKLLAFKILSIDSSLCLDSGNIGQGHPIVFIYFSPDCNHCQNETKEILDHVSQLKHTKIYWVTNDPTDATKEFYSYFRFDTVKNMFVCKDYNYSFYRAYLPPDVPYIAIYNSKNKLVKVYRGETNIQSIISSVQD